MLFVFFRFVWFIVGYRVYIVYFGFTVGYGIYVGFIVDYRVYIGFIAG